MAAFNALLEVDEVACTEVNAGEVILERGAGRRVAIVGHFPFVERMRQTAAKCWVVEMHPRPGDVPAGRIDEVLPQADVVALMGTSIINHIKAGVDGVSGTRATDPERVLRSVGQGATFRQIKRAGGLRLLTQMKRKDVKRENF